MNTLIRSISKYLIRDINKVSIKNYTNKITNNRYECKDTRYIGYLLYGSITILTICPTLPIHCIEGIIFIGTCHVKYRTNGLRY
jgi:hypothetical protein